MRVLLTAALAFVIAGCGQPERPPESRDQAAEQAEQRPDYGLGAPIPEPVIDDSWGITNEISVEFREGLSEERVMALVDSLARELHAAVVETRSHTYTAYEFRWAADLNLNQDTVLAKVGALPDVREVRPGIAVSGL